MREYERVRHLVLNVLNRQSDYSEKDILEMIGSRKLLLLTTDKAFALISFHLNRDDELFCKIGEPDENSFALIHLCGGETNKSLNEIFGQREDFESLVKSKGYNRILAIGRKGWKPFIQLFGFNVIGCKEKEFIYEKEVL